MAMKFNSQALLAYHLVGGRLGPSHFYHYTPPGAPTFSNMKSFSLKVKQKLKIVVAIKAVLRLLQFSQTRVST